MGLLHVLFTCYGMIDIIIPHFAHRTWTQRRFWLSQRAWIRLKLQLEQPTDLKSLVVFPQRICQLLRRPPVRFFDLPTEIRQQIYEYVCEPLPDGSVAGALHLLILNKSIHQEALPYFNHIPHTIIIPASRDLSHGPVQPYTYGLPRLRRPFPAGSEPWHSSIRRVVLVLHVWGVGTMTPDTFDVLVPYHARPQWKSLKSLIGIWPEVIETPLEEFRLVLLESPAHYHYRADVIRLIRNFKRTRIYAETGNCADENQSVLLPLARAFNQARRNWVKNATYDEHLMIEYDAQKLDPEVKSEWVEAQKDQASKELGRVFDVVPTNDTSRTDDFHYPAWTDREEQYVRAKLVDRQDVGYEWMCRTCFANFDSRKELRAHHGRGRTRDACCI